VFHTCNHASCGCKRILITCRQLPYLVGNVVEILDLDVTAEAAEEGANIDLDATRVGKSAVIKTSTRQTIFLPLIGLVDHEKLKPGDLIGVNKDSYLVLDTLPAEYDSRVKAMEVDEKPTEKYTDVGGLDKQIEELVEAVVWPMKEAERFKKIGIKAPKGIAERSLLVTCGLHPRRCSHVRPARYWKNPPCPSVRGPNRCHLPQARRSSTGSDVHRRWC
jgi:ATP-dependent 26S proteasome regulatory subunit